MRKYRPELSKCVPGLLFGCDFSGEAEDPASLFPEELPPEIRSLTLPFSFCGMRSFLKKECFSDCRLDAGGFLPESLSNNLFTFHEKRLLQFIRYSGEAVRKAHSSGFCSILLEADWNGCMKADADPAVPVLLLKKLSPVLEETGITLLLPVSFPLGEGEFPEKLKVLLNRTGAPRIKLRLDVRYPAPGKPFPDPEEAGLLLQETAVLRFIIDEGDGSEPNPDAVTPWLSALGLYGYDGPCIFRFRGPVSPSAESLLTRSAEWAHFLKEKYHG